MRAVAISRNWLLPRRSLRIAYSRWTSAHGSGTPNSRARGTHCSWTIRHSALGSCAAASGVTVQVSPEATAITTHTDIGDFTFAPTGIVGRSSGVEATADRIVQTRAPTLKGRHPRHSR